MLDTADKQRLQAIMFQNGKLTATLTAQSASYIAKKVGLLHPKAKDAKFLMVEETGYGPSAPFSGEKLSPVLTVWRASDFKQAKELLAHIYSYQGAGHSVGLHTAAKGEILEDRAAQLAQELPVARV